MADELPRHGQPPGPIRRVRAGRQRRPRDRALDRDRDRPRVLEIGDEAEQQQPLNLELVAERATHPQVVLGPVAQRAHAAPPASGHGRASARSASRSTFAYIEVVATLAWRRIGAICASGVPARNRSLASV